MSEPRHISECITEWINNYQEAEMNTHPFGSVETITAHPDEMFPSKGNQAYYEWIEATIVAVTQKPVPWVAVDLAITLDRLIREHEAESVGGPKCDECIARDAA